MSDEQIVEALLPHIEQWDWDGDTQLLDHEREPFVHKILAALRDAGFEVYRPEDAEPVHRSSNGVMFAVFTQPQSELVTHRLVPVSGESQKEEK